MTMRIRSLGYNPGSLPTGPQNSILDVNGVSVGQSTIHEIHNGIPVHKGVTVILPRPSADIQIPCYAGLHTLNGNGELTGSYQIKEWGFTNTPIALTNSTSLGTVYTTLWKWVLNRARAQGQDSTAIGRNYGTPVVAETCDWMLNVVEDTYIEEKHVEEAFKAAETQEEVLEGSYGGGAGMSCHGFKGGVGTSSRAIGEYMVGVIVQTNYGFLVDLSIGGVPIGKLLAKEMEEKENGKAAKEKESSTPAGRAAEGSIVIVIMYRHTDAPMLPHQLQRLAQRATLGLAAVGGHGAGRCHSGDIFLALSTANRPDEQLAGVNPGFIPEIQTHSVNAIKNESINGLFRATSEATEEAILNSLVGARDGMTGQMRLEGMPVDRVRELLKKYLVVV